MMERKGRSRVSLIWRLLRWAVRVAVGLAALGLAAGLAGVAYVEVGRGQAVELPSPPGQYPVGRTAYDWVSGDREDPLAPEPGAKRELLVWVWYPAAQPPTGAPIAPYLPPDWRQALEDERGALGTQLTQDLGKVRAHAVEGAALSDARARYPVLVLMPGYGSAAPNYTTLAEELASHGYVVAGISPTYTTTVVFPDGRVTGRTPAGTIPETPDAAASDAAAGRLVRVWAADARFVLDQLQGLNEEGGGAFAGRLDLSRAGFLGHSLGGAASMEACRLDARCGAAVDMDGTLYGDVARLGLAKPAMFLLSGGSASSALARQAAGMSGGSGGGRQARDILTIEGAAHFNFSDYSVMFVPPFRLLGALGPIDGRRGLAIASAYVREFFDRHLGGLRAPLLDGPSPEYPEVAGRFEGATP